ncbi:hypothetical protein U1Q18_012182 [Sarracenia purpurea var. burkii]
MERGGLCTEKNWDNGQAWNDFPGIAETNNLGENNRKGIVEDPNQIRNTYLEEAGGTNVCRQDKNARVWLSPENGKSCASGLVGLLGPDHEGLEEFNPFKAYPTDTTRKPTQAITDMPVPCTENPNQHFQIDEGGSKVRVHGWKRISREQKGVKGLPPIRSGEKRRGDVVYKNQEDDAERQDKPCTESPNQHIQIDKEESKVGVHGWKRKAREYKGMEGLPPICSREKRSGDAGYKNQEDDAEMQDNLKKSKES